MDKRHSDRRLERWGAHRYFGKYEDKLCNYNKGSLRRDIYIPSVAVWIETETLH